ncbi:MAG: hypothetical protein ABI724_01080 [Betaproteobacteria bacterium]
MIGPVPDACRAGVGIRRRAFVALLGASAAMLVAEPVAAAVQTVCTITVNSADEKDAFQRYLPPEKYQFVELVERGRPDWLASACRTGVKCDVLVVSGHYDGGNEFFSDRLDASEFLPVAELERVSCSDSCPGLFSQLKDVYLFGCNTLNPEAQRSASAEAVRSLVRGGLPRPDAERIARVLNAGHGESSRDRMRQVFKDVPAIHGFSSVAPLGPKAGSTLSRYFQATGTREIGSGRANAGMLGYFAANSMVMTRGMTDADPHASVNRDVCQFVDDRLSDAQRLRFIHQLLQRRMAEVRMFLDRIEGYAATLDAGDRRVPEVAQALDAIVRDVAARERYLEFARDADQPVIRARMLELARTLGWLSPLELRAEQVRLIDEMLAKKTIGAADVDLACTLNAGRDLDGLYPPPGEVDVVAHDAVRACLGDAESHAHTLEALFSPSDADVRIAHAYLLHRPIADVAELRKVTAGIARMGGSDAQVRALQALGQHRISDPDSLEALTRLFPVAESLNVQTAIAGVLIRADYRSMARPEVVRTLRESRRKSAAGDDVIDALIRRLQLP